MITRRQPRRQGEDSWEYLPLAEAMAETLFENIGVYVTRSQNTVAQYIVTQPILDLSERSDHRTGAWVSWHWWEQEIMDLEGVKERVAAESYGEKA